MQAILVILSALVGVVVGAVINALADDLPFDAPIRVPHYPDGTPRPRGAWIGLLAFLTGKRQSPNNADGKTSKISWRHPLTEIVTAALFAYIAYAYPFGGRSLFWMGCMAMLVLITVIDLEHRLILWIVMIPAYIYTLIGVALFAPEISAQITFQDYLIGAAAGFIVFLLMYLGGVLFNAVVSRARGEEVEETAFGFGDVLLATLSGLMLGWQALIFAVTIAIFAGGAGALLYLLVRLIVRGEYEYLTALPYGQYIVFGTVIMMLWRAPVVNFLQQFQ
jgi:leader peptidase (prepilin peptidase) / N-methyltransferase